MKTSIHIITIPAGSNQFDGPLFPTAAELPCRIIIIPVLSSQLSGNRKKNPYFFRRVFKKFFIKRNTMSINGVDIGSAAEDATKEDDPSTFYRFWQNMGFVNSPYSCQITQEMFNHSSFYSVWDLTTTQKPCNDIMIPTVRSGIVKFTMTFSSPTTEELILLVHSENPSLLAMDEKRKMKSSYYTSLT